MICYDFNQIISTYKIMFPKAPRIYQIALIFALSLLLLFWFDQFPCFNNSTANWNLKFFSGQNWPFIAPIKTRFDIPNLLQSLHLKNGTELGVKMGDFSEHLLKNWPDCEKLFLVDLWAKAENYKDLANGDDKHHESVMQIAKQKLKKFERKTEFIKARTDQAVKMFQDKSLQFIYLDARHDYCAVKADLELWWPKLQPGGILAGHDYMWHDEVNERYQDWTLCEDGRKEPGAVKRAVDEFAQELGLHVTVTYREPYANAYLMRKPNY